MAQQMLNQAALSKIKGSGDFVDLKKLNNQPLDPNMENSNEIEDYVPFTPLGGKLNSMNISSNGSGDVEDTDRFKIRNMDESESDEDSLDGGVSHDAPENHDGSVNSQSDDTMDNSNSQSESVSTSASQSEPTADLTHNTSQSDCTEANNSQSDAVSEVSNVQGMEKSVDETGQDDSLAEQMEALDSQADDKPCKTSEGKSQSGQLEMDTQLESAPKEKTPEKQLTSESTTVPENETLKTTPKQSHKSDTNDVKTLTGAESHEMECQTENVSDTDSGAETEADGRLQIDESLDHSRITTQTESANTSLDKSADKGHDAWDNEEATLTMICSTITKETLQECRRASRGSDDDDFTDDGAIDDDDEEYYEKSSPKKKMKRKPKPKTKNFVYINRPPFVKKEVAPPKVELVIKKEPEEDDPPVNDEKDVRKTRFTPTPQESKNQKDVEMQRIVPEPAKPQGTDPDMKPIVTGMPDSKGETEYTKVKKTKFDESTEWKDEYGSSRDLDGDPEKLRVPFEHGWKRELVIRGVYEEYSKSGQPKRKPADVYYFTPDGQKLRSKIMISTYLNEVGSSMTQENFSFIRRPIHKPPAEMVRQAGKSKGRHMKSPASHTPTKSPGKFTPPSTPFSSSPGSRGRKRKRSVGRPRKYSPSNPTTPKKVLMMPTSPTPLPPAANGSLPPPEVVMEREGKEEPYVKPSTPDVKKPPLPSSPTSTRVSTPLSVPPKKTKSVARKSTTQSAKKLGRPPKVHSSSPAAKISNLALSGGQLCGLSCPGRHAQPPNLQCGLCMCLFHPECVNFVGLPAGAVFVCLRCKSASKQEGATAVTTVQAAIPTMTTTTIDNISAATTGVPISNSSALRSCLNSQPVPPGMVTTTLPSGMKTYIFPLSGNVGQIPQLPIVNSSGALINPNNATVFRPMAPGTLAVPGQSSSVVMVPSDHQSVPPPKLTLGPVGKLPMSQSPQLAENGIHMFNVNKQSGRSSTPTGSKKQDKVSPDSIISISNATLVTKTYKDASQNGGDPSKSDSDSGENKSTPAQLLTLPSAVVKRLNLTQPLALKINNVQIVAPPSCFLKSKDSVKVCLPPNSVPVMPGTTAFNMQVKLNGDNTTNSISVLPLDADLTSEHIDTAEKPSKKKAPRKLWTESKYSSKMCHARRLWCGFEALVEIFNNLLPVDLLRARRVCKTWKRLVNDSKSWQHLELSHLKVKHWSKALIFLRKVGTESLDFGGCTDAPSESVLFPALSDLPLERLHLGEVTPTFIETVAKQLKSLTHLTATLKGDSNSCLDFIELSSLVDLKVLRLCESTDNKEENRIQGKGLAELVALTKLEDLSLTAMMKVDENDWTFLGGTTRLQQLELSDCSSWNSSTYFLLGQCSELEVVKLRQGGELVDNGLADSLLNLTKLRHLELEEWVIPHTLSDVLSELNNLETFTISPDSNAQAAVVNRNILAAVWDLSHLKTFRWGIGHSQNSTIILNEGDDEGDSKPTEQTTQCIPFLADDVESDDISSLDLQQMTQFISIDQLQEKLTSLLPDTKVDVYLIAADKSETKVESAENSEEKMSVDPS